MNKETVVTILTQLVGLGAVIFGASKDTIATIQDSIPAIVGGVMAIISTVAYIREQKKAKLAVFTKMVEQKAADTNGVTAQGASDHVLAAAKSVGLI